SGRVQPVINGRPSARSFLPRCTWLHTDIFAADESTGRVLVAAPLGCALTRASQLICCSRFSCLASAIVDSTNAPLLFVTSRTGGNCHVWIFDTRELDCICVRSRAAGVQTDRRRAGTGIASADRKRARRAALLISR